MSAVRISSASSVHCNRLSIGHGRARQLSQRSQLFCRAASGRPDDRSWAELASEAADLAKYCSPPPVMLQNMQKLHCGITYMMSNVGCGYHSGFVVCGVRLARLYDGSTAEGASGG